MDKEVPMLAGQEIFYGNQEEANMVMSEKVQSLAGSIYQEFERMIQRYDEDVVKTLMPLLVNVLECLDAAYQTNQEQEVELELLREDNEQLVTQYEREKGARKQSEQKLLETEDLAEQENKDLASRLESLESIVRMLELKHKNSMDHASRLEEREAELKKEYNKLHERYTELFKTHVDYMERTKMIMGNSTSGMTHSQMSSASERLELSRSRLQPIRSSGPVSYGFASLENSTMLDSETMCSGSSDNSGPPSFQNEIESIQTVERAAETETLQQFNKATSPQSELTSPIQPASTGRSTTKNEKRSANTLYQELSFQDDNLESEENEVTGAWVLEKVHPGEYASSVNDNFFGMGKEVENLIMENNELLATKNALNIVKDDLIVKVDELTGEIEILREELNAVILARNKLKVKVSELEDELKKTKEQIKQGHTEQEEEGDVPMAQRKRFTRVEMARVLMERNQYKERFMELQDAVRWTEMMRATQRVESLDKKSKQSIWKFFSNLFSSNDRPQREPPGPLLRYNTSNHHITPGSSEGRYLLPSGGNSQNSVSSNALVLAKDFTDDVSSERAIQRRREQYRQVRAHVQKEDGRLQAYGWSLPSNKIGISNQAVKHTGVPVPVYCRPLSEASPHMKVWCASGVNLNGGFTKDGGCMIGASVFYSNNTDVKITEITTPTDKNVSAELESLDKQISYAMESCEPEQRLSSLIWICTSTHSASTVTVIDGKTPADVLDSFPVCQNHLLCICTVMGALEKDYALLENSEITNSGEILEKPGEGPDDIGKVLFVRTEQTSKTTIESTKDEINIESSVETNAAKPSNDTMYNLLVDNNVKEDQNHNKKQFKAVVEDINVPPVSPLHFINRPDQNLNNNNSSIQNLNNLTFSNPINPLSGSSNPLDEPVMSSVGPTMWLGAQDGMLYVHSSVARWRICLHQIKLPDSVLSIVHVDSPVSRVVVALANGALAVFRRQTSGEWDLNNYHILTLGSPKQSVRCLTVVGDKVWAAHRNKIHIVDPISLNIIYTLEAHPRKESQIRQMTATGLGVWVSIRLDSTLRLYHSQTYEHIQDVDIEPYVSKMLGTGKLGFSFVRITALLVSCNRLWIGTGNGVVISVPLTDNTNVDNVHSTHTFIPKCCMANAQLSFHGHRDAVKFFVAVPMSLTNETTPKLEKKKDMLVMSGGEGYIDFRLGDGDMENSIVLEPNQTIENRGDKSYIIVWQVNKP